MRLPLLLGHRVSIIGKTPTDAAARHCIPSASRRAQLALAEGRDFGSRRAQILKQRQAAANHSLPHQGQLQRGRAPPVVPPSITSSAPVI
jgi:hypothetical protein